MDNLDFAIKAAMLRGEITNPGIVDKGRSNETLKLITLRNSLGRTLSRIPLTKVAELKEKGEQLSEEELGQLPLSSNASSSQKLSNSNDNFLKHTNVLYKALGALSTIGIIIFFFNQTKLDTLTYKGKTYTASKACGFGKSMHWKTSGGFFGIGANAKEIGCMTRNEIRLLDKGKRDKRNGILRGIAVGVQRFSEGYSQGVNAGNSTTNFSLQNQIQSNKFRQDQYNRQQSYQQQLQRNQQFNNQQSQQMQQFRNSFQTTPNQTYGGYKSPY